MSRLPDDAQPQSAQPEDTQPGLAQSEPDARPLAPAITAETRRSLVERAEVVSVVAWIALVLIVVGLVSFWIWSARSGDEISQPPRFLTDINSAPAAELALLPGIGPELAGRIVAERQSSGRFASAQQLARVRGIGPKTIEQIIPLVICGEPSASTSPLKNQPSERAGSP